MVQWSDDNNANSPWLKAPKMQIRATREGWCYQHVQAIVVFYQPVCGEGAGQSRLLLNRQKALHPGDIPLINVAPLKPVLADLHKSLPHPPHAPKMHGVSETVTIG